MSLSGEELRRRILSAAELHGFGMRGVRDALERYDAPRTLAEAMIRGEQNQGPRNIRDLSEALDVPAWWFTDEDLDARLATEQLGAERVLRLEEKLDDVLDQLDGLKAGQATVVAEVSDLLRELVGRADSIEDRLSEDG
jgi:hypothetical protein